MLSEVIHEKIACTIMREVQIDVTRPVVELCIWCLEKTLADVINRVTVEVLCQHRHPFVCPTQVRGMSVPMNHMLELMGQCTVVVRTARDSPLQADIEHLTFITIGI